MLLVLNFRLNLLLGMNMYQLIEPIVSLLLSLLISSYSIVNTRNPIKHAALTSAVWGKLSDVVIIS